MTILSTEVATLNIANSPSFGGRYPFALSLSKGLAMTQGFDKPERGRDRIAVSRS